MRLFSVILCLICTSSFSATHCVRRDASGTRTGADWTDAYTNIPTTLTRGDTYYVAGGSYGAQTFDDAVSGATTITIKRATTGEHGTDTGWDSSYDSEATFIDLNFHSDFFVFDGVKRSGWTNGYGFRAIFPQAPGVGLLWFGDMDVGTARNVTVRYVDLQGSGNRDDTINDRGVYIADGSHSNTIEYCYIHDTGESTVWGNGFSYFTLDHCWIARNHNTPLVHAGGFILQAETTNIVIRYNYWEDIEGTAFVETPSVGHPGCAGPAIKDWYIYGNVFFKNTNSASSTGNGLIYVFDATIYGDFVFSQNTVAGLGNAFVGVASDSACGQNITVQNNLFWNCGNGGGTQLTPNNTTVTNVTWTHNSYFDCNYTDSDANKQESVGSPFINYIAKNYNLAIHTTTGTTLSSPYNVDMNGVSRLTPDRGAFEWQATNMPAHAATAVSANVGTITRP